MVHKPGGNSFYGKIHNEETLKKMSEARKGRLRTEGSGRPSQKVEVFDLTTDIKTTYDSISDAARALGVIKSGISMYLNRNTDKPFKGRYIIKKINNLTQHIRDEQLMKNLIVYLDCGNVSKNRGAIYFQVTNFSDLTNKIIPIFQKYPLRGKTFRLFWFC